MGKSKNWIPEKNEKVPFFVIRNTIFIFFVSERLDDYSPFCE
jgi:hypothetical protein